MDKVKRGRHATISVQRTRTSTTSGHCHAVHICTMFAHPRRYDYCPEHTSGGRARCETRSETCIYVANVFGDRAYHENWKLSVCALSPSRSSHDDAMFSLGDRARDGGHRQREDSWLQG